MLSLLKNNKRNTLALNRACEEHVRRALLMLDTCGVKLSGFAHVCNFVRRLFIVLVNIRAFDQKSVLKLRRAFCVDKIS